MREIRVLIVEDEKEYREDLAYLINKKDRIRIVGEAERGEDAVGMIKRLAPDVVLMDIDLSLGDGKMDGIEATKRIREINESIKVIILTKFNTDPKLFNALKSGAAGYITKTSSIERLTDRIKESMNGGLFSPDAAKKITDYFYNRSHPDLTIERLSDRENQIAGLIANGHSDREIAEEIGIAFTTVRGYVKNIFKKLKIRKRIEIMRYIEPSEGVSFMQNSRKYHSESFTLLKDKLCEE